MRETHKVVKLSTIKAFRGESLTIDLQKTITGTLTVWLKRDPTDLTYRSFTVVDGRYLFLPKEKAQDYYSDGLITEKVEGRWEFDVRHLPVGTNDPNDEKIIITGSVNFSNQVTDSNGVEVDQTPEAESGMIDLSNTSTVYGTPGQIVKAKDLIIEIAELKTVKAMRGESLTIDLGKSYPDHKLEAWLKKDANANTYRSFTIVDQRYLFLPIEKTQDYFDTETNKVVEKIKGRWFFDVRAIPNEAVNSNDESVIIKGEIYFEDEITGTPGEEFEYTPGSYENSFLDLSDTPINYEGQSGKILKVNQTEDAVVFEDLNISSEDVTQYQADIVITSSQISDLEAARVYEHDQGVPSLIWTINHNLNKKPSAVAVDSADSVVFGQIDYINNNTITITFNAAFSGYAYIN
jgi:hypothetical protein